MIWYPYEQMKTMKAPYKILDAEGVHLYTKDQKLIDSISSWWCMIHGYKNKEINEAMKNQIDQFSHVMLGGLTHEPVLKLSEKLKDFDNVYINQYDDKYKGLSLYLNLPSHKDYKIDELIKFIKAKDIKGVVFNNYRDLNFVSNFRENNIKIRIGRYLNVFNRFTYKFYQDFAEMISASVEETFASINENAENFPVEILAYGRMELMNMRHCPFSTIKKCGLVGCETCKFNSAEMINESGNRLKIIRNEVLSVIYPNKASKVDKEKLSQKVSLLVSAFDDKDIDEFYKSKEIDNLNYDRGVI